MSADMTLKKSETALKREAQVEVGCKAACTD